MSNIVAVLIVRCTHTGVYADGRPNRGSVTLYDLDEITIQKNRTRYVPIPPGSTVDIPMSTRTFVSWHKGDICKFTTQGLITSDLILQLRDKEHCGGPAGTGQALRPAVLNIERVGNVLRFVIPDNVIPTTLDSIGFLVGEPIEVTGLTGAFRSLNGTYTISTATPGTGLAGPAAGSYLVEVPSVGPDIGAATLAGVNLCLTEGRVTSQFNSAGNVGGLGTNVFGYVGGQALPGTGGGGALAVLDEGILVDPATTTLNFVGAGVTAVPSGPGAVDVLIPASSGSAIVFWGNDSVGSSTAARVLDPGFEARMAPLSGTTAIMEWRAPRAGTVRNLYVVHNAPGGSGAVITYTVYVNGAPTAVSVGVASTAATGADTVNSAVIAAGDRIRIEVTKVAVAGGPAIQPEVSLEVSA